MSLQSADVSLMINEARGYNQQLAEFNQQLVGAHTDLNTCLKKIVADWESTGQDKEEYVTQLERQIKNMEILSQSLSQLTTAITDHLDNAERIGAKTL